MDRQRIKFPYGRCEIKLEIPSNNFGVQVSERSGETEDTWLADLAVAINSGQIKTGCHPQRDFSLGKN